MNKKAVILGAGGHAKVLIDCLLQCNINILGLTTQDVQQKTLLDIEILGSDDSIEQFNKDEVHLVNGIGLLPGDTKRKNIFSVFKQKDYKFLTVIHPSAIIAIKTILAEGVQVMAGSVIQPDVCIGMNTIINTRATVDHDTKIGQHCHVAPGATISGGVIIGDNVCVGAGATIIQGINIGDNAVIAAGATVYKDIPSNTRYIPNKELTHA